MFLVKHIFHWGTKISRIWFSIGQHLPIICSHDSSKKNGAIWSKNDGVVEIFVRSGLWYPRFLKDHGSKTLKAHDGTKFENFGRGFPHFVPSRTPTFHPSYSKIDHYNFKNKKVRKVWHSSGLNHTAPFVSKADVRNLSAEFRTISLNIFQIRKIVFSPFFGITYL